MLHEKEETLTARMNEITAERQQKVQSLENKIQEQAKEL